MHNIHIRNYRNSDLSAVLDLIMDSFESKFTYKQNLSKIAIRDILERIWEVDAHDPSYLHYVAYDEQRIVGVILVQIKAKKKSNTKISLYELSNMYGMINIIKLLLQMMILENRHYRYPYIEHIAVSHDARGKGIGKMLLNSVEEKLKHQNEEILTLAVTQTNAAKHLYTRLGFKVLKSKRSRLKAILINEAEWDYMIKKL